MSFTGFYTEDEPLIGLFNGYASRLRDFNYADLLEMLFPGDLSSDVFLLFARMHLNSVLQVPLWCKFSLQEASDCLESI